MTRTELQRRELAETARHNKEQEKIGIYGAIASGIGSYGSILRGAGALVKGKQPVTNNRSVTNNNNAEHYHMHHDNVSKYYGG